MVGYMYFYGYLKFLDISAARGKQWESKFPFKNVATNPGKEITLILIYMYIAFVSTINATGGS
jgi:hypothetical protein